MTTVYEVSSRVDRLEDIMGELAYNVNRLSLEMAEFKDEMAEFKDEMSEFKDEMSEFKDEMSEFKDGMAEFKEESVAARRQADQEMRQFRQQLAGISDKMGTLAEDLIAPSIPRLLQEVVDCAEKPQMVGVRLRKRLNGRTKEYDVVAVCGEYVLINETKSRLRPGDVGTFVQTLQEAREFLPEYASGRKIIGALGTFYIDPSLVVHGSRQGVIMLGVVDGLIEVLNETGFVPEAY